MDNADKRRTLIIALGILLACWSSAFALNPTLDVSQYAHTSWKISEGFSEGTILSIAQTADGYLWLGTEFGLRRFDGVRAVPWEPPVGQHLPSLDIRSLQGARDGRLWIGTGSGLASWKGRELTHYPELDGQRIEALLEDREGAIWVAGWALSTGRLCRIQSGNTQCYGEDGRFGSGVTPLYEDSGGNLWAGGMNGLWRWKPGPPQLYPMLDPTQRIYALLDSDDGGLLIAQHTGITKVKNGKAEPYPLPAGFQPHRLLRDRDGGLWIGALEDRGLLHLHKGRTDRFTHADGLSGRSVTAFFEDREGNIWVATAEGLDRFRDYAIPTFSPEQGLSSLAIFTLLSARDGSLWFGASDGLNRWNKGDRTVYLNRGRSLREGPAVNGLTVGAGADSRGTVREIADSGLPDKAESLFQDQSGQLWVGTRNGVVLFKSGRFVPVASMPYGIVFSFTDDSAGNVWVSHQEALFHLIRSRVVERIPWASLARAQPATALQYDGTQGGLWLGFHDGGVAYFKDGQLRATYGGAEGLGQGEVRGFYIDGNLTLWASTEGGLSRIKDGRIVTLTSQNGLPCNTVHWMMEDDAQSVWLYLACGLVRIGRSEMDAWASHPKQTIQATIFDSSDGVSSHVSTGGYYSVVTKSPDGKLWFVRNGGVGVIDPHHLAFNALPPPVHITQITADGKKYDMLNDVRLPAGIRDLFFEYTALTFVEPDKVHFRVKLEGQDEGWQELVNQRQVHYTNLLPKQYRFRVLASNNSDVWNEEGASLDFAIPPTWYQTKWFRAFAGTAFVAFLWVIHRLRVQQVEEREKKFREAVESMPALAFVVDPDGQRTFANRGWTQYTGMTLQQAFGFGWQAAIHPDDRKRVLDRWKIAVATRESFDYELRLRGADGEYRWFLTRVVPVRDTRGKVVKWCGVAADIEDRKRAEQLQAELAHINRVTNMGEITASIAHEINQPLSGIVSNGSACLRWLVADAPDLDELREAVNDIVRDGKRAGEIINTLRAMYKKTPPIKKIVDVNEIIGEMVVLLRSEAYRHAVSIRTDLAADIPSITADRVQLQQVLMNLMLNGIEAMGDTGGVLTVKSQLDRTEVQISVTDTGVGLPAENAERIFDAFFTTKAQGSGMGLAISRSIIESHGGRIWATANEGRGASFRFSLPMAVEGAATSAS
jgi:PAS domain S-box-containing protein